MNESVLSDTKEQEQVEENTLWPATPGTIWSRSSRESAGEHTEPSRTSIPEPRGQEPGVRRGKMPLYKKNKFKNKIIFQIWNKFFRQMPIFTCNFHIMF